LQVRLLKNFYFRNLLAIALILGGYALYLLPQFLKIGGMSGFCFFRSVTGIPCPGCGMGKASILLSQGDFAGAILMHPLAVPFAFAAFVAVAWLVSDLARRKETLLPLLTRKLSWPYFILLILSVIGAWIWNIIRK